MASLRTSLLVPIPEAEALVGDLRRVLDHTAGWGLPAHVTILYPFVPPGQVSGDVLDQVMEAVATVRAFDCSFDQVSWFADQVVWLAPADDKPFRTLTRALWDCFPNHPPYRGAIADPIPHLTVGDTHLAGRAALRQAAEEIGPRLPFAARVERMTLMAGSDEPGSWLTLAEFPLG